MSNYLWSVFTTQGTTQVSTWFFKLKHFIYIDVNIGKSSYVDIYMFVDVNIVDLAQASDIRIERRHLVFLCWLQDSNPSGSQTPNRQQTVCPLTNRLSYPGSSLKNLNATARPYYQRAFSPPNPQPFGIRTWLWWYTCLLLLISMLWHRQCIHTCLLLLISMLWHRQAIFESKGDKLSSTAECRIRTHGLRHIFASRLNAGWQTDWAIENQAKNLNSTARPYDQQAFSPLDLTASCLWHLALAIYMFVVVNFDALAHASDIRI